MTDSNALLAYRVFARLCRKNSAAIFDEVMFRASDRMFDCGEWSDSRVDDPEFYSAGTEVGLRLFLAVAKMFGYDPAQLDYLFRELGEYEIQCMMRRQRV